MKKFIRIMKALSIPIYHFKMLQEMPVVFVN